MAGIKTTGNADIDQATAEIAVALRHEHPGWLDQEVYNAAMNLRNAIMAGTRNLDELRRFGTTVPGYHHPEPVDADDTDRYDREAREEFKRTGATHTHVATSGNRVTRPGSRCPGATCYAMAVNEIDDQA